MYDMEEIKVLNYITIVLFPWTVQAMCLIKEMFEMYCIWGWNECVRACNFFRAINKRSPERPLCVARELWSCNSDLAEVQMCTGLNRWNAWINQTNCVCLRCILLLLSRPGPVIFPSRWIVSYSLYGMHHLSFIISVIWAH